MSKSDRNPVKRVNSVTTLRIFSKPDSPYFTVDLPDDCARHGSLIVQALLEFYERSQGATVDGLAPVRVDKEKTDSSDEES